MSYGPRGPGRPYGVPDASDAAASPPKKGSVRAARERMVGGREVPQGGPEFRMNTLRENPLASQYASMRSPQRDPSRVQPGSLASPTDPSQRQQSPIQWPLTNDATLAIPKSSIQARNPKPQRPQRPPNPDININPPDSYYDNRNTLSPQDALGEPPYWQDDDYSSPTTFTSPNPNRGTTSSQSTNSSLGDIPDFPVPTGGMPQQRRMQTLGPPPSARRGPSSYYSQASYVSPIAEESETRGSMGSFASRGSSNVIPSGVPEFYLEEGEGDTPSDEEDVGKPSPPRAIQPVGIVRQASLGKKTKPTLTTIRSSDNSRSDESMTPRERTPKASQGYFMPKKGQASPQAASLNSVTALLDTSASPSSSEESLFKPRMMVGMTTSPENMANMKEMNLGPLPPQAAKFRNMTGSPPIDPRVDQILGGLEKGGALDPTAPNLREAPKSLLGERVGQRRPPRLNVDAVRDAEARGSLTSLPDLIRRATKLAANLDRGKTASKLGMEWMLADAALGSKEKLSRNASDDKLGAKRRSEGSLSGILASFPNPGQATPTTPGDGWPSLPSSQRAINSRNNKRSQKKKKKGRRCCGMPLWGFIALVAIVILLIAAAVVIPVVLIVLPRLHKNNSTTNPLEACRTTMPCENGGTVTVQAGNTCGCICANGFTGPRCLNPSDAGCSSTSIPGQANATIGSSIAPLLDSASQFDIPLNLSTVLSLFASTNSTCASENALVTFGNLPAKSRRSADRYAVNDVPAYKLDPRFDPMIPNAPEYANEKRDAGSAATTSGLLLDGTATATQSSISIFIAPTTATVPASTADGTTPTSTATATSQPGTNSTALTFAQVCVLFVLQDSASLETAVLAQSHIAQYVDFAEREGATVQEASSVALGFGAAAIDLVHFKLTVANGSVFGVGAKAGAATTAATTTAATTTPPTARRRVMW